LLGIVSEKSFREVIEVLSIFILSIQKVLSIEVKGKNIFLNNVEGE
jgi:hypothetical protein